VPVRLVVNGVERSIDAAQDTPLLYALRNDLGLASPRFGCGSGECGACRVLLEGRAVTSCDTPLWSAAGKRVVTVEGLGTRERPHRLQRALLEEQAGQCGYCLSGVIVSAAALLEQVRSPSETQVREALERNLCRCGAHNRMVRAVLRAAREGA
jgi:nicotinate dehydrogenase subunit A